MNIRWLVVTMCLIISPGIFAAKVTLINKSNRQMTAGVIFGQGKKFGEQEREAAVIKSELGYTFDPGEESKYTFDTGKKPVTGIYWFLGSLDNAALWRQQSVHVPADGEAVFVIGNKYHAVAVKPEVKKPKARPQTINYSTIPGGAVVKPAPGSDEHAKELLRESSRITGSPVE